MEKHQRWTEEEHQELMSLMKEEPSLTYGELAHRMTEKYNQLFTMDAVRNRIRRTKKNKIGYADRKNIKENIDDYIEHLIEAQEKLQEFDDRQTTVTIDIDDDRPIGLAFHGDWHAGGLYTNHKQMIKDFEVMRDTDGLYNVAMGDYADNYTQNSHKGGIYDQIANPDKQKEMVRHLFKTYLGEDNLAVIKGNHDNWEYKETGEDYIKYLARIIESPYLWYGGEINLRLGNQVYKIHAHHTYQGTSALNTTNSQRRLFDVTHADVIALGHLHWNESHSKSSGGKDTVWMRTGTYKYTDDYSQWIGGFKGDHRVPMVILYPNEKKVLGFRDMYDGIKHLKIVRNEVTAGLK
ncbi:metallophosphoesterase [Halalkalibacterium halodurans]|uniref:hypothetical protein n=1 Tax=Halalkalibacterium halodurans TaxID=86665 RepID=UPI002E1DFD71|nr:metallophosphoesterase [Halalkalibacterium halodurans]MED4105518.1 metallophosphoesterase [Halalkalibacterium halodurans]MED4109276.1 metallophosphoesterase [Halalkalibacterium halodurans]MED4149710.1 metallophosphoesterase [Halalkalibacterium halodurans]